MSISQDPSRREFIHSSTTATGLGLFAASGLIPIIGQAAEAENAQKEIKRPRSNLGRIYKSVKTGGNVKEARFQKLKDLGFDGIESGSPGVKDIPALRAMSEKMEMPIHGVVDMVHWKKRLSDPSPEVRAEGTAALKQGIRDAYALGGSSVLLVPGRVAGENETHQHVWDRSIEEIKKVIPLASQLGIHVLIETVWNGFCESPEQLRDYIDEINNPWIQVYYDIGNMQRFGPSHRWIEVLGDRIVKMDVKDWGVKAKFCPLGQGDVDWKAVRNAIEKIGFCGWVTREGGDGGDDKTAKLMDELLDL